LLPLPVAVGDVTQGTVKPGLASLRERYRGRARDLGEDALGLEEALDAAREAGGERGEEVAAAQAQVGGGGGRSGGGCIGVL
jgi:hypothetical protein